VKNCPVPHASHLSGQFFTQNNCCSFLVNIINDLFSSKDTGDIEDPPNQKKREKIADNENIIKLLQNPCCLHNCLSNWTFNELKAYLSQKALYLQNKPSIQ